MMFTCALLNNEVVRLISLVYCANQRVNKSTQMNIPFLGNSGFLGIDCSFFMLYEV